MASGKTNPLLAKQQSESSSNSSDSGNDSDCTAPRGGQESPKEGSYTEGYGRSTLLVSNLSFSTTEEGLRKVFEICGKVEDVKIARERDTNISRGFGSVLFKHAEEAIDAATTLNQAEVDGRCIRVEISLPGSLGTPGSGLVKVHPKQTNKIFVKGFDASLAKEAIQAALQEAFVVCGNINSIKVLTLKKSSQLSGFAYIDFANNRGKLASSSLHGTMVAGGALFVDLFIKPRPHIKKRAWGEMKTY
eukprot:gene10450-8405_t